jgi:hypothetical protein
MFRELQEILSILSHDEERWVASLHWPINPEDVWWFGHSVFVCYSYSVGGCRERKVCFRFPAFVGDHSDDGSMLLCLHGQLADHVWTGQLSADERDQFDTVDTFYRLWEPIAKQLFIRGSRRG